MSVYSYDPPERFVAGTVGQPGERTFYLQASASGRVTSVALEKFQVSLLAERLEELLDEVLRRTGGLTSVPAAKPSDLNDDEPLDLPLMEDFRVGAIALAWDGEDEPGGHRGAGGIGNAGGRAVDIPENGPGVLRVRITATSAPGLSQRALRILGQEWSTRRCAACRSHRGICRTRMAADRNGCKPPAHRCPSPSPRRLTPG
jgi:uncharacterized repeat protein (TIGR03847 family)